MSRRTCPTSSGRSASTNRRWSRSATRCRWSSRASPASAAAEGCPTSGSDRGPSGAPRTSPSRRPPARPSTRSSRRRPRPAEPTTGRPGCDRTTTTPTTRPSCTTPTATTSRPSATSRSSDLGAQDDLDCGSTAGNRDEAKTTADRGGPRAHVLQALTGQDLLLVEAGSVVDDQDETLARSLLDPHLGVPRGGVLARVGEPFLHDPEDLDLLVGREPDAVLDLEIDLQLAVGGEEVDVASQRGVEGRRAAGRRQRQDGEARLLLSRGRGLLQLGERLCGIGAALEHRRVRGHGEEVLRQAVVDLPRDAGALLRDGAAELGETDRAPDADQQHRVRQQPQEVARRDVV